MLNEIEIDGNFVILIPFKWSKIIYNWQYYYYAWTIIIFRHNSDVIWDIEINYNKIYRNNFFFK